MLSGRFYTFLCKLFYISRSRLQPGRFILFLRFLLLFDTLMIGSPLPVLVGVVKPQRE